MPVKESYRIDKRKPGAGWWSEKERLQAVNAYVVLGKVTLVSATTGIPEDTLRKWKMADWWKEKEDEIRRSNKIELSGKLQNVVAKTLMALDDRVTNGDYFLNPKTGTLERKPISALHASKITNDLIDKTLLLEREATTEKVTEEGLDLRLKKLKEELTRFAKAKTIEGELVNELPQGTPASNPESVSEEARPDPSPAGSGVDGNVPTPSPGFDAPGVPPGYTFPDGSGSAGTGGA